MRLPFGSVVNAELASFVGLPAAGAGGYPWQYCRAGLEYSLSSELKLNAERVSGYQYTTSLISVLDPRKKHGAERQPLPPLAYFERNLNGNERNPADRIALAHVASLIHGADGPVQLPDAIALYMEKRHAFLTMVKGAGHCDRRYVPWDGHIDRRCGPRCCACPVSRPRSVTVVMSCNGR